MSRRPHPAGVRADSTRAGVSQAELSEQAVGNLSRIRLMAQSRDEHEVLAARQNLVDGGELPGEADRLTDTPRLLSEVVPVDSRSPGIGRQDGGEDLDEGGLSGTVGSEQREHRASGDVQVDAVENNMVTILLGQPTHADRVVGAGHRGVPSSPTALLIVSLRRSRSRPIH